MEFGVLKFQGGNELDLLGFGELGVSLDLGDGGLLDGVVFGAEAFERAAIMIQNGRL